MLFAFTDVAGVRLCRWALRVFRLEVMGLLLAVLGEAYPGVGRAARATGSPLARLLRAVVLFCLQFYSV